MEGSSYSDDDTYVHDSGDTNDDNDNRDDDSGDDEVDRSYC